MRSDDVLPLYFSAYQVYFSANQIYLSVNQVYFSANQVYFSANQVYLSANQVYFSANPVYFLPTKCISLPTKCISLQTKYISPPTKCISATQSGFLCQPKTKVCGFLSSLQTPPAEPKTLVKTNVKCRENVRGMCCKSELGTKDDPLSDSGILQLESEPALHSCTLHTAHCTGLHTQNPFILFLIFLDHSCHRKVHRLNAL